MDAARVLGELLRRRDWTIAVAESMTAGAVAQALATTEGSTDWFTGAIVAYATRTKRRVLGVTSDRVISAAAAAEMARGAAQVFGTDVAISTTGCAGPEPMEGQPVGTVWVGIVTPTALVTHLALIEGDPSEVRTGAVRAALRRAVECLQVDAAGITDAVPG